MKPTRLEKFYSAMLVVIFGGIVLHAPLSVALGVVFPRADLLIKSWKELLMLILTVVAVVIVTKRKLWGELMRDWLFRLIVVYALLHFILVVFLYKGAAASAAGLAIDLRYVLFFSLVYAAIKIMPQYRHRMVQVGVTGAFIVVVFATLQLFLPADILSHIGYSKDTIAPYLTVDKNPNYIRVNSTLRGPNPLGAYAGMVLGLLAAAFVRGKLEFDKRFVAIGAAVLTVCSVVALWISYSRSALAGGIITVLTVFTVAAARKMPRNVWIASAVVVVAIAGALAASKGSEFISNVLLHENPAGGSSISSNEDHVRSLQSGLRQLAVQPLGSGVGSTGSASLFAGSPEVIENQYLFTAHETGWLGLALFVALFGYIMTRLWRQRSDWLALGTFASGIGLALIGVLLPVWVDDTVSIVWWGLAAVAIGGAHERHKAK